MNDTVWSAIRSAFVIISLLPESYFQRFLTRYDVERDKDRDRDEHKDKDTYKDREINLSLGKY